MGQLTTFPSKRISLIRTAGEWDAIEKRLQDNYGADFHSYIRRETSRMANIWGECRECITPAGGDRQRRRHNIPNEIYDKLVIVAGSMRKDVSTVIDELLITPLLLQHKDAAL